MGRVLLSVYYTPSDDVEQLRLVESSEHVEQ
jgi:hypothetical protein